MENFIRIDKRKRGFKWVVSSLKEGKMLLKVNIDNQKKLLTSIDCYYWSKYYGESGIWFEQVDFAFVDDECKII